MGSDKNGVYRDSSGRMLTDYPRPSVAVDTALLTLTHGSDTLSVLQVKRSGEPGWALPGTFLHEGERLMDAVLRALRQKAGVQGLRPRLGAVGGAWDCNYGGDADDTVTGRETGAGRVARPDAVRPRRHHQNGCGGFAPPL